MTKSRNINRSYADWTAENLAVLLSRYPHEKTAYIARDLGMRIEQVYAKAARLGLAKTPEYLTTTDSCRLRRGDGVGAEFRFQKGHIPANKGIKGISHPGMVATQFKKGQKPHTWKPIGTIRYSKEGYIHIKLTDTGVTRRDYVAVHQLVWELHRGPIPPKHHVAFLDGNKSNTIIENLELVSFADMMRRNTIHKMPEELKEVIQLKGALNRRITCHERNERRKRT